MRRRRGLLGWLGVLALAAARADAAGVAVVVEQRDGAPLADAVLAAHPLDGAPAPAARPAVMDQRGRKFVPRVLVVQRGSSVRFTNSDTVTHHVYSFSPTRKFQLYLEKPNPAPEVVFDRAGVVTLGCNLHDWMLGYVVVVDTPHFGKTGADGRLELGPLAPGRYRLELWHPRVTDDGARLRHEIDLEPGAAGRSGEWRVRLERPLLPSREQEPAFREYAGR
jgi:plastocyanin